MQKADVELLFIAWHIALHFVPIDSHVWSLVIHAVSFIGYVVILHLTR